VNAPLSGDPRGDLYSAYVSARKSLRAWSVELGLVGTTTIISITPKVLSPRFQSSLSITTATACALAPAASCKRAHEQFGHHELIPRFSAPEQSKQFVRATRIASIRDCCWHIEGYPKRNDTCGNYSENILDVVTLAPEIKIDRFHHRSGKFDGQKASRCRSLRRNRDLQLVGELHWSARSTIDLEIGTVPRSFDQLHCLAPASAWAAGRWQNSAALTWHKGWPYTPLIVSSHPGVDDSATLGPSNSQRFGDFASVDLRAQYQVR